MADEPNLALLYPKWIFHRDGVRTCIVETPLQEAAKKAEEPGWGDKPNPAPPPPPPAPPLTGATEPTPVVPAEEPEPVPEDEPTESAPDEEEDARKKKIRRR